MILGQGVKHVFNVVFLFALFFLKAVSFSSNFNKLQKNFKK